MSIGSYALAETPIAQGERPLVRKTPPKRQYVALADADAVPEPH